MSLTEITKQIAKQALGEHVTEVLDGGRTFGSASAAASTQAPTHFPPGENLAAAIAGELQAMQAAIKSDMELVVSYTIAGETVRVVEICVCTPALLVLTCVDPQDVVSRVIAPAAAVQLRCKPTRTPVAAPPTHVRIVWPRQKPA